MYTEISTTMAMVFLLKKLENMPVYGFLTEAMLPSTFCIKFQSTAFAGRDLNVAFLVYTHFVFL